MSQEEVTNQPARTRVAAPQNPSSEQLTTQRATHWHQNGNPLVAIEDLRAWLQRSGLVLYTPKPQLGAPAPTLVEATLGKPNSAPELGELDAVRNLVARLIAEGAAVPLNLLGVTGGTGTDVPDFVVSAAVFSYIFTLRGNKAWKQLPVTSGPVKVSPLALAAYEILTAKVTLSAYDLTTQLGKEVTEAAVLRALTELWSQLRVIPVPQQDGSATLWELTTGRFTKQIKAGANAGQPSALSALISLYLGQAIVASEDEVESFLSPLAPRSRVREVLHALLSARQLETLVIDGKTLLHVAGELHAFAATAVAAEAARPEAAIEEDGTEGRIKKFAAKPGSKIGTGLRAKPAFGKKPGFGRPASGERERRPFQQRDGAARPSFSRPPASKPSFDKPWAEDRKRRAPSADGDSAARPERRPSSGDRPAFARRSPASGDSRPPRREFPPRDGAAPKRTFSKPGTFGRKREGGAARPDSEGRPPRREFGGDRPAGGGFKLPGSYAPRPQGGFAGRAGSDRPDRSDRPAPSRSREPRGDGPGASAEAPRKVFRKFDAPRTPKPFGNNRSDGPRPPRSGPGAGFGAKPFSSDRPKRTFDGARSGGGDRPQRPRPEGRTGFPGRPPSKGASKPGSFASKGGPFAKFADGKKPFRKPGAPKKTTGGFAPTRRKRDEDEQ